MCYKNPLKIKGLMCVLLIIFLSTGTHAACPVAEHMIVQTAQCRTNSLEPVRGNMSYQTIDFQDSFLKLFQEESLQKAETLRNNPEFQEIVAELQNNASQFQNAAVNSLPQPQDDFNEVALYIFVSFSMGEKSLLNLAHEAKQFGATLVLRGFHQGSYLKTVQALTKIITKTGQGVLIDPELYTLFDITAVPTFVLAKPFSFQSQERTQTPIKWAPMHDKLQGHVSVHYGLESIAKEGDLKEEATFFLKRGAIK